MTSQFTPHLNLELLADGSAEETWGQVSNENLRRADSGVLAARNQTTAVRTELLALVQAAQQTADARLPLAGGTLTGNLAIRGVSPVLALSKDASGQVSRIGGNRGNLSRWLIDLGDEVPEAGANSGSRFRLGRFDDLGQYTGDVLVADRATGGVVATGNMIVGGALSVEVQGSAPNQVVRKDYVDAVVAAVTANANSRLPSAGGVISGSLLVAGGVASQQDINVLRAASPGTGLVNFGNSGNRWIFWDGGNFVFNGPVTTNGHQLQGWSTVLHGDANVTNNLIAQAVLANYMRSNGNIDAAGDFVHTSDARSKDQVATLPGALAKVHRLRGVSYVRKADGKASIGVIAQEVEAVLPQIVQTGDDGMKSVALANIVGLLIEAIKELDQKVDDLGFEFG